MKLAFYVGDHAKDTWPTRAGAQITRLVQKGPYACATHVEAIHFEHDDGTVSVASSSLRDGGVRCKRTPLNPKHWRIVDVPQWDAALSIALLAQTSGAKYDLRGAVATAFLGSQDATRWFCNEWVAEPYLLAAANFGPHQLMAIALSLGREVTDEFFAWQEALLTTYWDPAMA